MAVKKMPHKHIHGILKKHSPRAVRRAKRLVSFKYPKLVLLIACIALAYYLFSIDAVGNFVAGISRLSSIGDFIGGVFFSFGFTVPFSIGFFLTSHPSNIFLSTFIAGIGSVIGDLVIFRTIKFSFMDEFRELEKKKAIQKIEKIVKNNRHVLVSHYLVYIFAGLALATPVPDEIGVAMLAGLTTIKPSKLAIISFILHAIPIFMLFYFSSL
jgi:hypothetical protein